MDGARRLTRRLLQRSPGVRRAVFVVAAASSLAGVGMASADTPGVVLTVSPNSNLSPSVT